jgi:hypothetical protein
MSLPVGIDAERAVAMAYIGFQNLRTKYMYLRPSIFSNEKVFN